MAATRTDRVIKLKELVELMEDYIKGTKTDKDLDEFGSKLMVRTYIPLEEKIGILILLLIRYSYSGYHSQEVFVGELYRNMFFYILLEGYAMIDCSDAGLVTMQNYDLLYPFFSPFILQYCKEDYDLMKEMLRDNINFYNMNKIIDGFGQLDIEALMKTSKSGEELVAKIENNQGTLSDLKELLIATDPNVKDIMEAFKQSEINK